MRHAGVLRMLAVAGPGGSLAIARHRLWPEGPSVTLSEPAFASTEPGWHDGGCMTNRIRSPPWDSRGSEE